MVYWAVGLAAMSRVAPNDKTSALPNIVIRKFFHFVAVVLFTPVIVFDVRPCLALERTCMQRHLLVVRAGRPIRPTPPPPYPTLPIPTSHPNAVVFRVMLPCAL